MEPLKYGNIPQSYAPLPKEVHPQPESLPIADPLATMNQTALDAGKTELKGRVSKGGVENESRAQAMERVSGEMWECVEQIPNKLGGFCYKFQLKTQYNLAATRNRLYSMKDEVKRLETKWTRGSLTEAAEIDYLKSKRRERDELVKIIYGQPNLNDVIHDKRRQIFPALEPTEQGIFDKSDLEGLGYEIFTFLGYQQGKNAEDGVAEFILPDKEALEANWEELRRVYREGPHGDIIPPLNIIVAAGIADDRSFVEAHLEHDVLLSSGKEMVHDHFAHIIPAVQQKLRGVLKPALKNPANPVEERANLTKLFAKAYHTLQMAEKLILVAKDPNFRNKYPPGSADKINKELAKVPLIEKHLSKMWAGLGAYVDLGTNDLDVILRQGEAGIGTHMRTVWNNRLWTTYSNNRFGQEEMKDPAIRTLWRELEGVETFFNLFNSESKA